MTTDPQVDFVLTIMNRELAFDRGFFFLVTIQEIDH